MLLLSDRINREYRQHIGHSVSFIEIHIIRNKFYHSSIWKVPEDRNKVVVNAHATENIWRKINFNKPGTAQVGVISKAQKDSKTTFSTTGDNKSSQKTKN